jgi:hypothetical protein
MGLYMVLMLAPMCSYAGETTLTWEPPTENEDGTPLTDLAGFKIFWGTTTGDYPNSADIPDPTATTYTVQNLTPGEWRFVATAYNEAGTESQYSNEAVKNIVDTTPLPPGGVAAAGDSAYIIVQSDDTLVLLDIGTIAADTQCSPDVAVMDDNGLVGYKVPVAAIVPYSPSQQLVVAFSQCGN